MRWELVRRVVRAVFHALLYFRRGSRPLPRKRWDIIRRDGEAGVHYLSN
jgi:hypothetical protein